MFAVEQILTVYRRMRLHGTGFMDIMIVLQAQLVIPGTRPSHVSSFTLLLDQALYYIHPAGRFLSHIGMKTCGRSTPPTRESSIAHRLQLHFGYVLLPIFPVVGLYIYVYTYTGRLTTANIRCCSAGVLMGYMREIHTGLCEKILAGLNNDSLLFIAHTGYYQMIFGYISRIRL